MRTLVLKLTSTIFTCGEPLCTGTCRAAATRHVYIIKHFSMSNHSEVDGNGSVYTLIIDVSKAEYQTALGEPK